VSVVDHRSNANGLAIQAADHNPPFTLDCYIATTASRRPDQRAQVRLATIPKGRVELTIQVETQQKCLSVLEDRLAICLQGEAPETMPLEFRNTTYTESRIERSAGEILKRCDHTA